MFGVVNHHKASFVLLFMQIFRPFFLKFIQTNQSSVLEERYKVDRVKPIWYLSPMRAAKVQASLRIRAVLPEPSLLAHTSSMSRGTFRQKARTLALLNVWACAVKICHDGMLEDTNSLDGAQVKTVYLFNLWHTGECQTISRMWQQ